MKQFLIQIFLTNLLLVSCLTNGTGQYALNEVVAYEFDWLINKVEQPVQLLEKKGEVNKTDLTLSNGLISRTFRLFPNAATTGFNNLMTGESILRAVKPEATVEIDGQEFEIGGLSGQLDLGYLRPEWIDSLQTNPDAFQFSGYTTDKIKARIPWSRNRYAADQPWPPQGLELVMNFEPPANKMELLNGLMVSVHYEMYQGIPVLSKRIVVHNNGSRRVKLNRFVSEILAVVEYEMPEEMRAPYPWHPVNSHVESDYTFSSNTTLTTHWELDPEYTTQLRQVATAPNTMKSYLPFGPDVFIEPGEKFESFRTFELIYDSTERERKAEKYMLERQYNVKIEIDMEPDSYTWLVIESNDQ